MTSLFRWICGLLLVAALCAMGTLVLTDVKNSLALTETHKRAGACSFILIGASYVCLQLGCPGPWNERFKAIFLGIGFLFWGSVQFLPASGWLTFMDTAVVLIFVVDLSAAIVGRLVRPTGT